MWLLIAGLLLFLGIHSVRVAAPEVRASIIEKRGEGPWRGIYSVMSLAGITLLVWGYGQARFENQFFYTTPQWLNHLQVLLMVPVMILLVSSQLPIGHIKRVVKNPMMIAVKIWAVGHLLVNADLASFLLFGTFLAWAVLLTIDMKRRSEPLPQDVSVKSDVLSVVIGLVLWGAVAFWLHELLIGVPVIA
ncbi:MAG: NnrU family protein [Pseudomonadota bacterium]